MSCLRTVVSSSFVIPQMAANSGSSVMLAILLMVLKMLSCENLVMPVMKANFQYWSYSLMGA